MSTPSTYRSFFLTALLGVYGVLTAAAPGRSAVTAPRAVANGVLFSEERENGLFLLTGGGVQALSQMPGSGLYYTVSPDGRSVGFKTVEGDGMQSLHRYDVERGTVTTVQEAVERVGQLSFAEDGTMAYTVGEQLHVVSGNGHRVVDLGIYVNIAPIAPDGGSVIYNDINDQLWMLDLRTMQKDRITHGIGNFALPQWSPDGKRILYSSLSGSMFVYDIDAHTTVLLGDGNSASWFDDATILYTNISFDRDRVTGSDIALVRADGSTRHMLTATADAFETEPMVDRRTGRLMYGDVVRGGLYSRSINVDGIIGSEQRMMAADQALPATAIVERAVIPAGVKTATAVSFAMPYVHQVFDTPDWYNGHSACGATSSIMVIAYYHLVPVWNTWCSATTTPPYSPAHMSAYGNYVCERYTFREQGFSFSATDPNGKPSYGGFGFMWTGSFSPHSRTVDYYTAHGMSATLYDSTTAFPNAAFFSTVIANVDSGYPFTLCNGLTTAGHIIVVNGYDVNNRTIIVNDPYGDKNTNVYPSLNGKGVKYDWVGYNNGYKNLNRIYWGVSIRCRMEQRADTLVDDAHLDKGFSLNITAPASLSQWFDKKSAGYGNSHFWWTRTKLADTCFAVWTPNLPKAGLYTVEAYIPYSDATKARYRITAQDSVHTIVANQKPVKNGWLPLGTFPFAQGTSGSVRLGDGSDTTKQGLVFDAVRWSYVGASPLSVASKDRTPMDFALAQNFPNPFNPGTAISYRLSERGATRLQVFDALGRRVAELVNDVQEAGAHSVRFDASSLSSGVYLYTLRSGGRMESRRMLLLK